MDTLTPTDFSRFFEEFARLRREPDHDAVKIKFPALDKFFAEFSALDNSSLSAKPLNIFEICKLGRDERRNCSVLAWLLDENGSHGLGHAFLRGFLTKAGLSKIVANLAGGYAVRTEYCPNADNINRVDIVLDGRDFLLYLEVKIDSREHGSQTSRYFERLAANAGGRETALVFLSTGETPENSGAEFITWREVAAILSEIASADSGVSAEARAILNQYAEFVRKF